MYFLNAKGNMHFSCAGIDRIRDCLSDYFQGVPEIVKNFEEFSFLANRRLDRLPFHLEVSSND